MKKLIFGLIATVMFGMGANAQEFTKQKVENDLRDASWSFYTSIGEYYKSGMSERDFFNALSNGQGFNNQVIEAKNVLNISYKLLSIKASKDQVQKELFKPFTLFTYQGLQLMYKGKADNINQASTILFGINAEMPETTLSTEGKGPNGDLVFTDAVGCKWYQVGCHLKWLFGTKEGRETLKTIMEVITFIVQIL
jgi:hypothetical protein